MIMRAALLCLAGFAVPSASAMRILVTGANKGIGKAICAAILAHSPDTHVLLAARDAKRGEKAVESLIADDPSCDGRLTLLQLDVSDDASVAAAAAEVKRLFDGEPTPLTGLVNNAGIGFGFGFEKTLKTNLYGPKRVCDAFLPLLNPAGRIVNIASASGPNFVSDCSAEHRQLLTDPQVTWERIEELAKQYVGMTDYEDKAYGLSKACLNAYTIALAREHPKLKINSVTPGYILTDLTRGMGATNPPEKGTKAALRCLFGELEGNGWYYGSDAERSPLDRYRAPGTAPYQGP